MEGDQSAAEQGASAMADEAMAADSTGAAAASTAANKSARVAQTPLGRQADDILIDNDEDDPLLGLNPSDTGGLHGILPHEGPHALTDHERDVKTWADEAHLGGSSSARTACRGKGYVFNYSAGKGNNTLKDHIARYHRDLNVLYTDKLTRHVIGNLKTEAKEALKKEIEGVHGVAIIYDMWMSRKTDDLLAICIHYITADWTIEVKKITTRLQTCATWTKKSSRGWTLYADVCARFGKAALTLINPVKTRFTSTWRMLARMLLMKDVVHQLFSEDAPISKRDRCPTPSDWHVAKAVVDELDFPCKVVVKAHDKGHWLLSDALNRLARLYHHLEHPEPSPARQEEQQDEEPTQYVPHWNQ
eukprot:jgi/Tetstr1/445957/TSEL_033584.t1